MGLVAGRDLEGGGLDLDEALALEIATRSREDAVAGEKKRAPVGVAAAIPEWRRRSGHGTSALGEQRKTLAAGGKVGKVRADSGG